MIKDWLKIAPTREFELTSTKEIVFWWELRRFSYNLIVGLTGLIAGFFGILNAFWAESHGWDAIGMPDGIFIIALPVIYGIMANICFSFGWIFEAAYVLFRKKPLKYASKLYLAGLIFSVLMTLLPLALFVFSDISCLNNPAPCIRKEFSD